MKLTDDLFFASRHLNRLLDKQATLCFSQMGLSPSHAFLLMLVIEQPRIQPGKLSEKLQLSPSTISRLIEKLEYRGYVERQSGGRATHVVPTKKGETLNDSLQQAWQKLQNFYTSALGERYTEVLTEMTTTASQQFKEEG